MRSATKQPLSGGQTAGSEAGNTSDVNTDSISRAPRSIEHPNSTTAPKAVHRQGYKGRHNVGSRKERAHQLFDQLGPEKARQRIIALGIRPHTVATWFSEFKKDVMGGAA
jgi:hypothetical protein